MIMLFVSPNKEEMGQHSCDAVHRFFFLFSNDPIKLTLSLRKECQNVAAIRAIMLQLKYESIFFSNL